jgi:3,4-dihydroxy 2-butanone 4-phosphate synthase/GTP cyclohydrolase II
MDVVRYSEARLPTPRGEFKLVVYRMPDAMPGFDGGEEHVAMVMGEPSGEQVLTRVHSSCFSRHRRVRASR